MAAIREFPIEIVGLDRVSVRWGSRKDSRSLCAGFAHFVADVTSKLVCLFQNVSVATGRTKKLDKLGV